MRQGRLCDQTLTTSSKGKGDFISGTACGGGENRNGCFIPRRVFRRPKDRRKQGPKARRKCISLSLAKGEESAPFFHHEKEGSCPGTEFAARGERNHGLGRSPSQGSSFSHPASNRSGGRGRKEEEENRDIIKGGGELSLIFTNGGRLDQPAQEESNSPSGGNYS